MFAIIPTYPKLIAYVYVHNYAVASMLHKTDIVSSLLLIIISYLITGSRQFVLI